MAGKVLVFEMNRINISPAELKKMIADYMEKGFLENIIDMYKHDASLYEFVGELMTDERVRVRLGIAAMIEALKEKDPDNVHAAASGIIPNLRRPEPVIRGDAAYLLGIIGQRDSLPLLTETAEKDENADVRLIAKEALKEIEE